MIVLENVNKSFNKNKVIDGLSFHIRKGEVVGFIGLNGAGKTTTINMLTGAIIPDSGYIRIGGVNPATKKYDNLRQFGYVNGAKTQLWVNMPLKDSFEYSKYMYKINEKIYKENMQFLCNNLGIDEFLNISANKLSLGQRIRADFAYAALHNPRVLYLDEPTIGLDLIAKERLINVIKELNKKKETTVLFANHNLQDIERTCSRVLLIHKGKKIYEGDLVTLKKEYSGGHLLKLKLTNNKIPDFQDLPINKYKIQDNNLLIYYDVNEINSSVILNHIVRQCSIEEIQICEPTLEEVIRGIYSEE